MLSIGIFRSVYPGRSIRGHYHHFSYSIHNWFPTSNPMFVLDWRFSTRSLWSTKRYCLCIIINTGKSKRERRLFMRKSRLRILLCGSIIIVVLPIGITILALRAHLLNHDSWYHLSYNYAQVSRRPRTSQKLYISLIHRSYISFEV